MKDSQVKQVVQKNVKSGNIVFVHRESNEPMFQREMTLIGEKGERALNESPTGEESQILADPDQANLVRTKKFNIVLVRQRESLRRSKTRDQRVYQKKHSEELNLSP